METQHNERLSIVNLRFLNNGPFNLTVHVAQCVGITGPSGIGKTLFLRAVADMDPHEGNLRLDGTDSRDVSAPGWRRQVGILPAESRWWEPTVGDHFPEVDEPLFGTLGLNRDVLTWPVGRLSSGERQRLALLRLISNRPKVLLLDEPTANLDRRNTERVEQVVADYRERYGAAVIWVGHDDDQLSRVASVCYRMQRDVLALTTLAGDARW